MTQLSKTALVVIKQLVGKDSNITIPLALMETIDELRTWVEKELLAFEEKDSSAEDGSPVVEDATLVQSDEQKE